MMPHNPQAPIYKRVLLKLSGEALMGEQGYGIDPEMLEKLVDEISIVHQLGVEICLVIGGGNIFRGMSGVSQGMNRGTSDYMGMLATVMNALAFQNALENRNIEARVLSAIPMIAVCETYVQRRAIRHLEKGRIVIFAAGTGNPYFTTDTAAALRALEMTCDVLLKGTQVDGVYSADPKCDLAAHRYDSLSYSEVLGKNLKVMDGASIALARENRIPILVFSIHSFGAFKNAVMGEGTYTKISEK